MSMKWRIQKLEKEILDEQAVYAGLVQQFGNPHLMGNRVQVRTKVPSASFGAAVMLDDFRYQTYNNKNLSQKKDLQKIRTNIVTKQATLRSMLVLAGRH